MGGWNIPTVFEIYSLGDADVLAQAFNGLAMITNSGGFARMVQAAFLVGILAFGARSLMTGRFELTSLLAGVFVYIIMFGPRATVLVIDSYSGAVRPVANVPIGVSAPFALVSYTGRYFAVTFETAFSTVGAPAQFVGAGYLDSLDVLLKMRNVELGTANAPEAAKHSDLQKSVQNYMVGCVLYDIESSNDHVDKITLEMLKNAPELWPAMKTDFPNISVRLFTPVDGPTGSLYTCQSAWIRLDTYFADGSAYYTNMVDPWIKASLNQSLNGNMSAHARLDGAMQAINLGLFSAQTYAINSILYNNLQKATAQHGQATNSITSTIITTQALNQRNMQWVAEKTMFEKVARPVTAFIELFLVAATPLIAFAIAAFGMAGVGTLGKFMLLHFWVTLWVPTLAIANLFSITRITRFVDHVQTVTQSGQPLHPLSIYGLDHITQQLQTEYATGCMLAAATPMLTLMLIYGSSQVTSMLAHKMTSAQEVDKSLASPSLVSAAPVVQQTSAYSGSANIGWSVNGATKPTYSVGQSAVQLQSSAQMASERATADLATSIGRSYSTADGRAMSIGYSQSAGFTSNSSEGQSVTAAWNVANSARKSSGVTAREGNALMEKFGTEVAARTGFGVDLGKLTGGLISIGSDAGQKVARDLAHSANVSPEAAVAFLTEANRQVSSGGQHSAEFRKAYDSGSRSTKENGYSVRDSAESREGISASLGKMQSAERQYMLATQAVNVFGTSASYDLNQFYESMSGKLGNPDKSTFNSKIATAFQGMYGGDRDAQKLAENNALSQSDIKAASWGRSDDDRKTMARLAIMANSPEGVGQLMSIQQGNLNFTKENFAPPIQANTNAHLGQQAERLVGNASAMAEAARPQVAGAAAAASQVPGSVQAAKEESKKTERQATTQIPQGLDSASVNRVNETTAKQEADMSLVQGRVLAEGSRATNKLTGGMGVNPIGELGTGSGAAPTPAPTAASGRPAAAPAPVAKAAEAREQPRPTAGGSAVLDANGAPPPAMASTAPAPAAAPGEAPKPAQARRDPVAPRKGVPNKAPSAGQAGSAFPDIPAPIVPKETMPSMTVRADANPQMWDKSANAADKLFKNRGNREAANQPSQGGQARK